MRLKFPLSSVPGPPIVSIAHSLILLVFGGFGSANVCVPRLWNPITWSYCHRLHVGVSLCFGFFFSVSFFSTSLGSLVCDWRFPMLAWCFKVWDQLVRCRVISFRKIIYAQAAREGIMRERTMGSCKEARLKVGEFMWYVQGMPRRHLEELHVSCRWPQYLLVWKFKTYLSVGCNVSAKHTPPLSELESGYLLLERLNEDGMVMLAVFKRLRNCQNTSKPSWIVKTRNACSMRSWEINKNVCAVQEFFENLAARWDSPGIGRYLFRQRSRSNSRKIADAAAAIAAAISGQIGCKSAAKEFTVNL